ncbi:MAG: molybdenum cofactor biosynthesis protein A [Methanocella sp. PtaU1.Bin125]|nr:MAG: molybdenum cofactor biosynthesis protein A [Methanocella sp. PtaU1.Bin125]
MTPVYLYKHIPPLNDKKYKRYLTVKKPWPSPAGALLDIVGLRAEYSRPIMIQCETANICTNDCIICAYRKMTRKKMVMPMAIFEKVLRDYSDMGGGYLSLTPKMGDIFCDTLLPRRLEAAKRYPAIRSLSVTTNAILADRYDDDALRQILAGFRRIQVSVYGLGAEEYRLITRRDEYARMVRNAGRMLRLADRGRTEIVFGFRFLKRHTDEEIRQWMTENFGTEVAYGKTLTFMDWNGALDDREPLPFDAKWKARAVNTGYCISPLVACVVFSNGDVTVCLCNDYDGREELNLGNVAGRPLLELLNSQKARDFWAGKPRYASVCRHCSSHRAIANFQKYEYVFDDPVAYLGA